MSGRLSMLEEQIVNMQRLIQLKDSELARLQAQSSVEGLESAGVAEGEQPAEMEAAAESLAGEAEVPAEGVDTVATDVAIEAEAIEEAETSLAADTGQADEISAIVSEPGVEGETLAADGAETAVIEEVAIDETAVVAPEFETSPVVEPPVAEPEPPVTATSPGLIQR